MIPILHEDEHLLVIDKPAGVVVNRAESVKEETVQDWAEEKLRIKNSEFRTEENDFINRAGIVHRLDKETSGCLLIAKNPRTFLKLQQAFKDRLVKKTYVALVHEKLVPEIGEIKAPVGRLPWNREKFGIVPGGKEALTRYKVKGYYSSSDPPAGGESRSNIKGSSRQSSNNTFTLVELYPESGRTHQIRVHLKYINHPIVGDYLYAGRKTQRADRVWCPRVFLHAGKIEFVHPESRGMIKVAAPLPSDLETALEKLVPTISA